MTMPTALPTLHVSSTSSSRYCYTTNLGKDYTCMHLLTHKLNHFKALHMNNVHCLFLDAVRERRSLSSRSTAGWSATGPRTRKLSSRTRGFRCTSRTSPRWCTTWSPTHSTLSMTRKQRSCFFIHLPLYLVLEGRRQRT